MFITNQMFYTIKNILLINFSFEKKKFLLKFKNFNIFCIIVALLTIY